MIFIATLPGNTFQKPQADGLGSIGHSVRVSNHWLGFCERIVKFQQSFRIFKVLRTSGLIKENSIRIT